MKKKRIIKKALSRVHAFRCTDVEWNELKRLAKECGISLNRYLVETSLKHHPRQRLTEHEAEALNSLTESRTDLIKIRSALKGLSEGEKQKMFRSDRFMRWWIDASTELIQHWYSIEENITSSVMTKVQDKS